MTSSWYLNDAYFVKNTYLNVNVIQQPIPAKCVHALNEAYGLDMKEHKVCFTLYYIAASTMYNLSD